MVLALQLPCLIDKFQLTFCPTKMASNLCMQSAFCDHISSLNMSTVYGHKFVLVEPHNKSGMLRCHLWQILICLFDTSFGKNNFANF